VAAGGGAPLQSQLVVLKKIATASEGDVNVYRSRELRRMPCTLASADKTLLPNFDHVEGGVYRGGQPFLRVSSDQTRRDGISLLAEMGVTDIIDLREVSKDSDPSQHPVYRERDRSAEEGIKFHSVPLQSLDLGLPFFGTSFDKSEPCVACVVALIQRLEKDGRVIYVHCAHGADRTGVVFAMLRLLGGARADVALAEADDHSFSRFQRGMRHFISRYKEPERLEEFRRLVGRISAVMPTPPDCPKDYKEKVL
jgi:protein-tyrosine phosphatase